MPDEILSTSTEQLFTGESQIKMPATDGGVPFNPPIEPLSLIEETSSGTATSTDYQGLSALLIFGCIIILIFGIIRILFLKKPDEKR